MTQKNRSGILAAAAAVALAASATVAHAGPAPATSGVDLFPLLPAACTVINPMIKSAKYDRKLTGGELVGSTLTCWLGPLGYVISVKKGWIEPNPLFN
jgi:hypothetical protein